MHEGVLILSNKTKEIIFFNKPAQKLLTNFVAAPQVDSKNDKQNGQDLTSDDILTKCRFRPVKISDRNIASFYKQLVTHSKEAPVSLEQIIMVQHDEPNQSNCIYKLKNVNRQKNQNNSERYI